MSSFKNVSIQFDVGSLYEGGIKVFVESEDDLAILRDKWFFNHRDTLSFESVSDAGGANGGCLKVIKKVKDFKGRGQPAFGIVDRDVLLQDAMHRESLWWETDDEHFAAAKPYGEFVRVLRRWEIENYLLQPGAIRQWLKDKLCSPTEPDFNASDILDHEEDFITISCISPLSVMKFQTAPGVKFGNDRQTADELRSAILHHFTSDAEELATPQSKILAFAAEEVHPESRWDKITRMLDGKRVLHRLSKYLGTRFERKLDLFDDRAIIAGYIANSGTIDTELSKIIEEFSRG